MAGRVGGLVRIAGGRWRGRPLEVPVGEATRPTGARVREAVGSILAPVLAEARVLDLFAGSGALGLECLSRGAAHLTAVERHPPTAALIRRNVAALGATAQTEVVTGDVQAWLERVSGTWDVVVADPPYAFAGWERLLAVLEPLLAPGATVLLERPFGAPELAWPGRRRVRVHRHGGTQLERWLPEADEAEPSPEGTRDT
ncbi:MAG: 16S rRNA (guanine(966)-N(2))-methyltransferase RsmD [Candidatus Sericytochromatia bacterium]|nr:16S rRNA (guanine(966)-N(2))-methyltransferase RsmD [Candidatus Sericytochromatia bacterium]